MNRTLVIVLVLATIAGGVFTLTQGIKFSSYTNILNICNIGFNYGSISAANAIGCMELMKERSAIGLLLFVGVGLLITSAVSLIIYVAHVETSKKKNVVKSSL